MSLQVKLHCKCRMLIAIIIVYFNETELEGWLLKQLVCGAYFPIVVSNFALIESLRLSGLEFKIFVYCQWCVIVICDLWFMYDEVEFGNWWSHEAFLQSCQVSILTGCYSHQVLIRRRIQDDISTQETKIKYRYEHALKK